LRACGFPPDRGGLKRPAQSRAARGGARREAGPAPSLRGLRRAAPPEDLICRRIISPQPGARRKFIRIRINNGPDAGDLAARLGQAGKIRLSAPKNRATQGRKKHEHENATIRIKSGF
jgi:hypothetical protein